MAQDVFVYHGKKSKEIVLLTKCAVKEGKLIENLEADLIIRFGTEFWEKAVGWQKTFDYAITPIGQDNWTSLTNAEREESFVRGLPHGRPIFTDASKSV